MPKILLFLILSFFSLTNFPANAEEKYRDLPVSVSVSSTFKLSADSVPVDFGLVDPGKTIELYPDRYFNEVKCVTNNGRQWYLKADCQNLSGPSAAISKNHLKIKVYSTNGMGYYSTDWVPFSDTPILIYTSGQSDNEGREVKVQFKYMLEPPPGIPAGNYNAIITYTMTEAP